MMAEKPMEKDDKDNRKEFLEISGDGSKSLSSLCIYWYSNIFTLRIKWNEINENRIRYWLIFIC